jgi:hypothetical protein
MIRAVKISYLVTLFSIIAFSPDSISAELPTPTATPAVKVDPIEANDPEFSGNFDSLYEKIWGAAYELLGDLKVK